MATVVTEKDLKEESGFDRLSDDVILFILQHLSLRDFFNLRFVSKRFAAICKDKSLVRHLQFSKNYWLTTDRFQSYVRPVVDKIETLNLNSCYWLKASAVDLISKCTNLSSLHLTQVKVSMKNLCNIISGLPNLVNLSFSISDIRDLHPELASSTGAQECLARLISLSLHFRHQLVYSNRPVINFCTGPTLFEYCRNLEEFHVYGFPSNARGIPKYIFQPQILKSENLKNVKVMTLNDAMDPAARMFFFGTLLSVCKLSVKFKTLLQPLGNVDQLWSMDGYATCLQNMEDLVHFDPSRTTFQIPSEVLHFESAHNLQYLNLSDNAAVTSETLHLLADTCPKLTSLNLQNCNYILLGPLKQQQQNSEQRRAYNDISGLQALLMACVELRSLNISGIHVHTQDLISTPYSSLAALLAMNNNWQCLSMSPCCLSVERSSKNNKRTFSLVPEGYLVKRRRIGTGAACHQSFATFPDANSPSTSQEDPSASSSSPPSSSPSSSSPSTTLDEPAFVSELEKLVRSCPSMENFELNCSGFRSAFNKYFGVHPTTCTSSPCMFSLTVGDHELMCIGRWKHLKSLQLTSIPGVNQGHCLLAIAKGCVSLEQLSIACLGQIAHCLYRNGLLAAFPFFSKLKDFRLEHPYMKVDEMMLTAMAKCSTLERVCIIAKNGTMDTEGVKDFFEKVQGLINFQLYTGRSLSVCRGLQAYLMSRYKKTRPAISVCIHPLLNGGLQEATAMLPDQHIDEMTILKSRVSIRPHDAY
ncbi:F-box/LRR-repeat protein 18 [Biomphalaria pfeifferi]|uniref:F-box/LRR-repeat protein 18 n=1 Tax=Biomphalaria pfeifferi TaxID=112525 RepID=A0AAD8F5Q9_BIOPF|nr:F-box/LRR-repeat protein 18 [Biomphalaria pfeifferi]